MFANHIQSGINFDKFDKIPVKALGESVPPAVGSFESSGLRQFLLDNVTKSGYTKPTPIQKYAIPIILGKRDLMGNFFKIISFLLLIRGYHS
jgi:probable ATP-dependent RNA helicase DDX4